MYISQGSKHEWKQKKIFSVNIAILAKVRSHCSVLFQMTCAEQATIVNVCIRESVQKGFLFSSVV